MFYLSKAVWDILQPGHLLLLALVGGWVMAACPGTRRLGLWLAGVTTAILVVLALLPVGDWLMRPLENRFPDPGPLARVDGIIVLGGGQDPYVSVDRDRIAVNDAGERMIEAAALSRAFPEAQIVFSGGNGPPGLTEADVAARAFAAMGLDPQRVIYENEARNTYESAIYLHRFITPEPGETWLLVTSAFHMPRSVAVFRAAGWDIVPYATDYRVTREGRGLFRTGLDGNLRTLNTALHEYVGLAAYRLMGRTQELFPAP